MRGLVFTEFLDFVEATAGAEMVETMIDASDLASGGAYTSVGIYDHDEILKMLKFLHSATGNEVQVMVHAFGANLFGRLVEAHPGIVEDDVGFLDFLAGIETHIHSEVRKLYPDAELPVFDVERRPPTGLVLTYQSTRPFADLAHGMLEGAAKHFGKSITLARQDIATKGGYSARFEIGLAA